MIRNKTSGVPDGVAGPSHLMKLFPVVQSILARAGDQPFPVSFMPVVFTRSLEFAGISTRTCSIGEAGIVNGVQHLGPGEFVLLESAARERLEFMGIRSP